MAEAAAAAATLAVVAQAYAATLAPSVVGGDTGELLAEACGLGTAHPPGYPVFTLLVHAAHRLAQAQGGGVTTAHAANALCAAFGALAACLVASSTVALLRQCPRLRVDGVVAAAAGAAAGCGYALSPLCWQYHITAEVFALNNLLCAALVRAALWVAEAPSPAALRTGAAVAGVALCNQHTSVLFAVPLVVWVLVACRRVWAERPSELAKTAAAFLLALAPYAYLPVAALAREQKGSWGNVKTFGGFLWHLRRGDYGTLQLYSGKTGDGNARLYGRLAAYAADLHRGQGLGVAVPLAVAGALATVYCGARGTAPPPGPPPAAAGKSKRSKGQGAKAKERPGKGPPAAAPGGGGGLAAAFAATDGHTVAVALAATMAVYLVVFHTLANLPLDNPLLFGIHQVRLFEPIYCARPRLTAPPHNTTAVLDAAQPARLHVGRVRLRRAGGRGPAAGGGAARPGGGGGVRVRDGAAAGERGRGRSVGQPALRRLRRRHPRAAPAQRRAADQLRHAVDLRPVHAGLRRAPARRHGHQPFHDDVRVVVSRLRKGRAGGTNSAAVPARLASPLPYVPTPPVPGARAHFPPPRPSLSQGTTSKPSTPTSRGRARTTRKNGPSRGPAGSAPRASGTTARRSAPGPAAAGSPSTSCWTPTRRSSTAPAASSSAAS